MVAPLPRSTSPQPASFTARDYWVLADSGAFRGFVKTELIEGELLVVNRVYARHARVHADVAARLVIALRKLDTGPVGYMTPSTLLSEDSIPEPDIALAERTDEKALPGSLVKLAVEIADSSLMFVLDRKANLYARHGIPEYWVFDVEGLTIYQHWQPGQHGYGQCHQYGFADDLTAKTIAGLTLNLAYLKF
ncbi:MAG: hypothetical protein RL367_2326 [Pseudomonadota bacterium]